MAAILLVITGSVAGIVPIIAYSVFDSRIDKATKEEIGKWSKEIQAQIDSFTVKLIDLDKKSQAGYDSVLRNSAKSEAESESAVRHAERARAAAGDASRSSEAAKALVQSSSLNSSASPGSSLSPAQLEAAAQRALAQYIQATDFRANILSAVSPSGVVVASTKICSDLIGGWENFGPAAGKMIVGVGEGRDRKGSRRSFLLSANPESSSTGDYDLKLKPDEMPAYVNGLIIQGPLEAGVAQRTLNVSGKGIADNPVNQQAINFYTIGPINTEQGRGPRDPVAFDIMPPYIALHWCKKI